MPFFSDEIINEIFLENDIVDYVSQYVRLKKSGRDYSGLCPFHREKSPSFHVSQDKQLFHCFGCGASGNLVQFVMRTESLDFIEAIKLLADRVGIVLPEDNSAISNNEMYKKKQLIYEMNKESARFFYNVLVNDEKSESARQYLVNRQIKTKTIITFGIGFAPNEQTALFDFLINKGYKKEDIIEAGLATERDGRVYDRFRNRVIFPIIDLRGNIIGFGGRIIDNITVGDFKPPKYLNSSETPVFSKGKNLFSLNLAKREKNNEIILVEGYMDVVSVYQVGFKNIVATLGTALTEQQAKLLLKYCQEIVICYDSDDAGQAATMRAIDIINSVGGKSRVVKLKGSKDPDDYIKENGIEMFKTAIKNAVPSTEFKILRIKNKYDLTSTDGKIKFVNDAAESLVGISDNIEVDAYIKKMSEETDISKEAIYSAYKKKSAKSFNQKMPSRAQYEKQATNKVEHITSINTNSALIIAEKKLLNLIISYKKLFILTKNKLTPDDFSTALHKQLALLIYDSWENGKEPEPAKMLLKFAGTDAKEVSSIFYNLEIYDDDEKTVNDLIRSIKREKIQIQITNERDPSKIKNLLDDLTRLGEEV